MAADGTIRIDTRLDAGGVKSGVSKITDSIKGIASALGVVKLVSQAVGVLSSSLQSAFNRSDTMEQFDRTMSAMTGDAEAANKALEELKTTTKGTAYGLDVAAKATQNFVTRGMDMSKATNQVAVWADAVAFYGKGTNEQFESVTDALAKMRTKGKVEMDQLDRLFDAGIDAVGMYAKVTGQSSSKVQAALSEGEISADQFIDTVTNAMATGAGGVQKIAGAAKEAGASWQGTMDNMKAAVTRGMLGIIDAIDNGLQSINLPTLREMIAGIGSMAEEALGKVASAVGTIIQDLGPSIQPIIATVKEAFQGITPIVKEVADAVYGFIKDIVQSLQNGGLKKAVQTVGDLFTSLAEVLGKIAKAVLPVIADAVDFLGENLDMLIPLVVSAVAGFKGWQIAKKVTTYIKSMAKAIDAAAKAETIHLALSTKSAAAATAEAASTATSTAALTLKELVIGTLTGKIGLATAAQALWNATVAANPFGAVITAVSLLVGGIGLLITALDNGVTSTKNLTDTFETMGEGASNFVEGIDTAKSHLSEFNDVLFVSSEEQQNLQTRSEKAQSGINEIYTKAVEERERISAQDLENLRNYVAEIEAVHEEELENEKRRADAVKQRALSVANDNALSLSEYQQYAQEWIKTAQEQADQEQEIIEQQATQRIVNLQKQKEAEGLSEQWYQEQVELVNEWAKEELENTTKNLGEITAAYANGYAERSELGDLYSRQVGKRNESLENETQRHNDRLKEIGELNLFDESVRLDMITQENAQHEKNMKKIWGKLTDGMSEEQKEQLGVLLGMAAQTEVYGGKLEDETLSTVNAIINALDSMPPETREAALNALRPVYEELEKAEPKLTEKVSGMLNSIVGTVKRLLGIHSPSRVMRKLSKYTWQGFELETDKAGPRLIDQAKELAQGIIKGFELPQVSLPFHVDTTGLDIHSLAASLEETARMGRASMSSAIMARAEQQIINQLDTSAIARACREGCEAADVTVEGELRAEFSADGRQLGEVVTPYVNKNMGLQRRALLRGGKA